MIASTEPASAMLGDRGYRRSWPGLGHEIERRRIAVGMVRLHRRHGIGVILGE
ncbi:MAG: hypothetical protein U1F24_05985 [Alphaproteobacteria bacterium]